MKNFLRSGELARLTGVSTDTLRFYERRGLIPWVRRSNNGYREYSRESLDRVKLIRSALSLGFTIKDLAEILRERDRGGTPCRRVRQLAEAKLNQTELELEVLKKARNHLRSLLRDWDIRLSKTDTGQRASLLEELSKSKIQEKKK